MLFNISCIRRGKLLSSMSSAPSRQNHTNLADQRILPPVQARLPHLTTTLFTPVGFSKKKKKKAAVTTAMGTAPRGGTMATTSSALSMPPEELACP